MSSVRQEIGEILGDAFIESEEYIINVLDGIMRVVEQAVLKEREACAEIARSYSIEAYHEIVERGVGNDSPR